MRRHHLLALVVCGLPFAACGAPAGDPRSATHIYQAGPKSTQALLAQGGQLIADYGSFSLIECRNAAPQPADDVEPRDDYRMIFLNAATIDSADPAASALRHQAGPVKGRALHLVQFAGPVRPEWYEALRRTGVRVVTYIPENAYLVYGTATELLGVQDYAQRAPAVRWDGVYLDDYKVHPSVHASPAAERWVLQLVEDPQSNPETVARLRAIHKGGPFIEQSALGYLNLNVHAHYADIVALADAQDLVALYPSAPPRLHGERLALIAAGAFTPGQPRTTDYLGWLASKGFTQEQFSTGGGVDISDSGLDNGSTLPNHHALYVSGDVDQASRVVYSRLIGTPNGGSTLQGCDGHGTINGHLIAAFEPSVTSPHIDALGYRYNLGIAPFARVGSSVIFDPNNFTFPNYAALQSQAYQNGMRVSSNAWGAGSGAYTTDSQTYDALVRDAQPAGSTFPTAGNQEMVMVFAAGTQGPGAGISSPGTAKNGITVGGSEGVFPYGAADGCGIADTDADDSADIVSFSSRGPCSDGRIKPDLVAPATHLTGGVFQDPSQRSNMPADPNGFANGCYSGDWVCGGTGGSTFFPTGQQWTTSTSGTSHAAAIVSGAALLVRQYLINTTAATPSAAMVKGYLLNSARYLTGNGANDDLYSNAQGMGRLDLGQAFDETARILRDQEAADLFTASGQVRTFDLIALDPEKPLRVTLAWTDAPGSTVGNAYRNNLDLSLTVGGQTYKGNVFSGPNSTTGGVADTRNNVESVYLTPGATGPFTLSVVATNINSDGVPGNTSPLDQDFALVVYNACSDLALAPALLSAQATPGASVQLSWSHGGFTGNTTHYSIYRATSAGGPYTFLASVPVAATGYEDNTVIADTPYFYVARGTIASLGCATSPSSNEASGVAPGLPSTLVFSEQPTDTTAGTTLAPAVKVEILSQGGFLTNATAPVTLALGTNPGNDSLHGTITVGAVGGIAVFDDLSIERVGAGYTLAATSAGLTSAQSTAFTIGPGAPAKLIFSQQPPTTNIAGATFVAQVNILDAFDNRTDVGASVSVTFANNPAAAQLSGITTIEAAEGVATFADLSVAKAAAGYTLAANSASLATVTSAAFDIRPASAKKLTFRAQPTDALVDQSLSPAVGVAALDSFDNLDTAFAGTITLALSGGADGAVLSGTLASAASAGAAAFADLAVNQAGAGYSLTASSPPDLVGRSEAFTVTALPTETATAPRKSGCGCLATSSAEVAPWLFLSAFEWQRRRKRRRVVAAYALRETDYAISGSGTPIARPLRGASDTFPLAAK